MTRTSEAINCITIDWHGLKEMLQESNSSWRDQVAAEFNNRFIMPLESAMPSFLKALEKLSDEVRTASILAMDDE